MSIVNSPKLISFMIFLCLFSLMNTPLIQARSSQTEQQASHKTIAHDPQSQPALSKNPTPSKQVLDAFTRGDYEAVAPLAEANPTAPNLILAARAYNTIAYLSAEAKPARTATKHAYNYAKRALEKDPLLVEAHVQSAISDAIRGGKIAPFRAFLKGLAKRSRKSIDKALEISPNDPWALSTSGAWHLEVSRAGGGRLYGAKLETGYDHLMKARELSPDNIVIGYEASLRLLAAEKDEWRNAALEALNTAITSPQLNNAYEKEVRRRAIAFKAAIQQGRQTELAYIKAQD